MSLGLPTGSLVVLIDRDGDYVVPQGTTALEGGDVTLVLADAVALGEIRGLFARREL